MDSCQSHCLIGSCSNEGNFYTDVLRRHVLCESCVNLISDSNIEVRCKFCNTVIRCYQNLSNRIKPSIIDVNSTIYESKIHLNPRNSSHFKIVEKICSSPNCGNQAKKVMNCCRKFVCDLHYEDISMCTCKVCIYCQMPCESRSCGHKVCPQCKNTCNLDHSTCKVCYQELGYCSVCHPNSYCIKCKKSMEGEKICCDHKLCIDCGIRERDEHFVCKICDSEEFMHDYECLRCLNSVCSNCENIRPLTMDCKHGICRLCKHKNKKCKKCFKDEKCEYCGEWRQGKSLCGLHFQCFQCQETSKCKECLICSKQLLQKLCSFCLHVNDVETLPCKHKVCTNCRIINNENYCEICIDPKCYFCKNRSESLFGNCNHKLCGECKIKLNRNEEKCIWCNYESEDCVCRLCQKDVIVEKCPDGLHGYCRNCVDKLRILRQEKFCIHCFSQCDYCKESGTMHLTKTSCGHLSCNDCYIKRYKYDLNNIDCIICQNPDILTNCENCDKLSLRKEMNSNLKCRHTICNQCNIDCLKCENLKKTECPDCLHDFLKKSELSTCFNCELEVCKRCSKVMCDNSKHLLCIKCSNFFKCAGCFKELKKFFDNCQKKVNDNDSNKSQNCSKCSLSSINCICKNFEPKVDFHKTNNKKILPEIKFKAFKMSLDSEIEKIKAIKRKIIKTSKKKIKEILKNRNNAIFKLDQIIIDSFDIIKSCGNLDIDRIDGILRDFNTQIIGKAECNGMDIVRKWRFENFLQDKSKEFTTGVITEISENSNLIVTGSKDCSIRLWDPVTLDQKKILTVEKFPITTLIANKSKLYSGSEDGKILKWDLYTSLSTLICHHSSGIYSLHLDSDSHQLYFQDAKGVFFLIAKEPGLQYKEIYRLNSPTEICRLPDALITANEEKLLLDDLKTNQVITLYTCPENAKIVKFKLLENQKIMFTTNSGMLNILNIETKEIINLFEKIYPEFLTVSGNLAYFISSKEDLVVKYFINENKSSFIDEIGIKQLSLFFNAGELLVVLYKNCKIKSIFNSSVKWKAINSYQISSFSTDSSLVAYNDSNNLIIFDILNNKIKAEAKNLDPIWSALISKDNNFILSAEETNIICLWKLEEDRLELKNTYTNESKITCIELSKDGKFALAGTENSSVVAFELNGEGIKYESKDSDGAIKLIALSPSNSFMVSFTENFKLILWNFNVKTVDWVIKVTDRISSVCFAESDEKFLTGGEEGVKVWDLNKNSTQLSCVDNSWDWFWLEADDEIWKYSR